MDDGVGELLAEEYSDVWSGGVSKVGGEFARKVKAVWRFRS